MAFERPSLKRVRPLILLLAGMALFYGGCAREVPVAKSPSAYTLPQQRPVGTWESPRDRTERHRLHELLGAYFSDMDRCSWQYTRKDATSGHDRPKPIVGTIGVDRMGKVVWFELGDENTDDYALRECLSRTLVAVEFQPPPTSPVLLVFTLPLYSRP